MVESGIWPPNTKNVPHALTPSASASASASTSRLIEIHISGEEQWKICNLKDETDNITWKSHKLESLESAFTCRVACHRCIIAEPLRNIVDPMQEGEKGGAPE